MGKEKELIVKTMVGNTKVLIDMRIHAKQEIGKVHSYLRKDEKVVHWQGQTFRPSP